MSRGDGVDFLDQPLPAKLAISLIPTAAAVVVLHVGQVWPWANALSMVLLVLAYLLPNHAEEGLALRDTVEVEAFGVIADERGRDRRIALLAERARIGEAAADVAIAAVVSRMARLRVHSSRCAWWSAVGYGVLLVPLALTYPQMPWLWFHVGLSAVFACLYAWRWCQACVGARADEALAA